MAWAGRNVHTGARNVPGGRVAIRPHHLGVSGRGSARQGDKSQPLRLITSHVDRSPEAGILAHGMPNTNDPTNSSVKFRVGRCLNCRRNKPAVSRRQT
jgi:hypothetical protein